VTFESSSRGGISLFIAFFAMGTVLVIPFLQKYHSKNKKEIMKKSLKKKKQFFNSFQ